MPKIQKPIVHLFIPYQFQELERWHKEYQFQTKSLYLSKFLKQFTCKKTALSNITKCLFSSIGLENSLEAPLAHYRYQTHKTPIIVVKPSNMLVCADPIHLAVGMNDITLTEQINDLTDVEAKELIALLNQHFKQDNLSFIFGENNQWYLKAESQEVIRSTPLEVVIQQQITKDVVTMGDRNWQAIQTEIQMLLHSSEVNQQRELAGLPTVNSLWLWGGGMPLGNPKKLDLVIGGSIHNGLYAKSIAKATGAKWMPLTEAIQWDNLITGDTFIVLDELLFPAISNQLDAYQQALSIIDNQAIKPLLDLWRSNQIEIIIDSCDGYQLTPIHVPTWKVWLKEKSLLEIAQKHLK